MPRYCALTLFNHGDSRTFVDVRVLRWYGLCAFPTRMRNPRRNARVKISTDDDDYDICERPHFREVRRGRIAANFSAENASLIDRD